MAFKQLYPDTFRFFSKAELAKRNGLPKPKPDAILTRTVSEKGFTNDYFLDSYEASIAYLVIRKRFRQYIEYAENNDTLATILIVCETKALQGRLLRLANKELENSYVDLGFLAITMDDLTNTNDGSTAWLSNQDKQSYDLVP